MDFNLFLKIFLIVLIEKWSKVSWSNTRNMLDIHLVLHQKKKQFKKQQEQQDCVTEINNAQVCK